ncbi:hypothetical protein BG011_001618 [Mortierella polycephala]|uniref:Uncharacterized protein n=1 Tax=Mortierella polycephala TaxID=41804 RepID=A0A9P6Q735_9FUNG|nr:hypothetical protein BG011_001618 [Mortierella polycephala]
MAPFNISQFLACIFVCIHASVFLTATADAAAIAPLHLSAQTPPPFAGHPPSVQYTQEEEISQPTQHLRGWPSSLDIEIDTLEIGGLSLPSLLSLFQNEEVGSVNYGNIGTGAGESGMQAVNYPRG